MSGQTTSLQTMLANAFTLIFKDEFTNFSTTIVNVFNNKVPETLDSRDFLRENDDDAVIQLKNTIFQSLMLAFQISNNKVLLMGEADNLEGEEFEVSVT